MNDLKKKAIEISNKFSFNEISSPDDSCENHLDKKFIDLLEQGAHLDFYREVGHDHPKAI